MYIDQPINVIGVIAAKDFKQTDALNLNQIFSETDLYDCNIGTGKFDRIIVFKIRQLTDWAIVDIYADIRLVSYPLGLIPGVTVKFNQIILCGFILTII